MTRNVETQIVMRNFVPPSCSKKGRTKIWRFNNSELHFTRSIQKNNLQIAMAFCPNFKYVVLFCEKLSWKCSLSLCLSLFLLRSELIWASGSQWCNINLAGGSVWCSKPPASSPFHPLDSWGQRRSSFSFDDAHKFNSFPSYTFKLHSFSFPLTSVAHLLVAVLHSALQLALGGVVLLEVDLLEVLDGRGVEVVELCPQGSCGRKKRKEGKQEMHINAGFPLTLLKNILKVQCVTFDPVCGFNLTSLWCFVQQCIWLVRELYHILGP